MGNAFDTVNQCTDEDLNSGTTSGGPQSSADTSNAFMATQLGTQDTKKGGGKYTVVAGDSLSKIARTTYGDPQYWTQIRDANPERVFDGGNLIIVDSVLILPIIAVPSSEGGTGLEAAASDGFCEDPAVAASVAIKELLDAGDIAGALAQLGTLGDAEFAFTVDSLSTPQAEQLLEATGVCEPSVDPTLHSRIEEERTEEVVIPTTLLKPAKDTIDADFKRANEIYNPYGIEVEKGNQVVLTETQTKKVLGGDTELDEFTSDKATNEELELIKHNRTSGRLTGYWVPTMPNSRGEGITTSLTNILAEQTSLVINASSHAQDTFPHELGHVLGLPHENDKNNLMGRGGGFRDTSGKAGTDKLTKAQLATIRQSAFIESGKKGLGR